MTDRAPDDIFALFSRFDLDGDDYQVFHRETKPSMTTPAASIPPARVVVEEQQPSKPVVAEMQRLRVELIKERIPEAEATGRGHRTPTSIRSDSEGSRSSLQNLWRHVASARTSVIRDTPESLAADSISVTGVAGGVGTTTIAALLTRMLAKSGARCGLFDDTEDPTLPIYFGAQRIADEQRRFAGLRSIFEPRVRIVNRKMFEPMEAGIETHSFLQRNFAAIAQDFDHLVFDRPARSFDCSGAGVKIHIAVPDLSSLARVQKLLRDLDESGANRTIICVLNRFETSIPLHREIVGWYRENFQTLVLIRESSLVSEALAEATTVIDWLPDSAVASDFLNLFSTVRQCLGTESERLPLCS